MRRQRHVGVQRRRAGLTVTDAKVAPELNERIGFTPEEVKNLVDLDYAYMTENDVALKEWWDKEFKG